MANEALPGSPDAAPKAPFPVIQLVHTLVLLGALGLLVYTKHYFKRPPITEATERERLVEMHSAPEKPTEPGILNFDTMTMNISGNPSQPKPADGTSRQIEGKLHYVTVGFTIEIRDKEQTDLINSFRPFLLDKVIHIFGKKKFHELNHVQGRYVLRTELIDTLNQSIATLTKKPSKEGVITNLYFNQFLVQ